jgi:LCP family protein required for cell wall assembly
MKLTDIKEVARDMGSQGSGPDRTTLLLIALAVILAAVSAAIGADILFEPASRSEVAQGDQSLQPPSPSTPSPVSTAAATPIASTPPPCVAPHDWGIHIVQGGNTLYALAQHYGTNVKTLKRVNCLDSSTILVDQRLYVPGPLALPTPATATPAAALAAAATPQPVASATLTAEAVADTPDSSAQTLAEIITPVSIPAAVDMPASAFRVNIPDRYLNIILLGSDLRPEEDMGPVASRKTNFWRTDAIIIVSLDVKDNTVRLLHIPRDLWVYIPDQGYDRINSAELWGELAEEGSGPDLVKQTVYYNLGIPIHYYIRMDFAGFINIVNTLGGVDIDVACPLPELNLDAGMHHLDGAHALKYVESRETASDFDRGRRQREMLMALWDQALTPDIIPKLPQLWVTMGDNFKTDLPLDQVINLAYLALQLNARRISMKGIDHKLVEDWTTPAGAMVLRPREDELRAMLEDFYAPADMTSTENVEKVRVQVLNGWQGHETEKLAVAALRRKGIKIVDTGQASRRDNAQTQIIVRRGDMATGEWIAEQLQVPLSALQDETAIPDPPNPSNQVDIRVILGADYDPCQR